MDLASTVDSRRSAREKERRFSLVSRELDGEGVDIQKPSGNGAAILGDDTDHAILRRGVGVRFDEGMLDLNRAAIRADLG